MDEPLPEGILAAFAFSTDTTEDKSAKAAKGKAILEGLSSYLQHLSERRSLTIFATGAVLKIVKAEELWKLIPEYQEWWQFGNFCDLILKTSLQRANAFIRIWDKSQQIGLTPDEIEDIGWAKAQQVIRVAKNRGDVNSWLKKAKELNQEDFVQAVRETQKEFQPFSIKSQKLILFLADDEKKFVDEIIEYAAEHMLKKEIGDSITQTEVLLFILADWRDRIKG